MKRLLYPAVSLAVVCLTVLLSVLIAVRSEKKAHAAPKPGLWIEQTTVADGVRVRRIHDTFDGVLCYVASTDRADGASPSIACVLDRSRP